MQLFGELVCKQCSWQGVGGKETAASSDSQTRALHQWGEEGLLQVLCKVRFLHFILNEEEPQESSSVYLVLNICSVLGNAPIPKKSENLYVALQW